MGYCYTTYNGRNVLVCDACGNPPARKVPCPVRTGPDKLPWCPALALCAECRKKNVGEHSACRAGAAKLDAEIATIKAGRATFTLRTHRDGTKYLVGEFGSASMDVLQEHNNGRAKSWADDADLAYLRSLGNTIIPEAANA